ncbi:non-ribosomal peptide synthetase module [Paenibacillus xerothermodurans]|uniref:Non-ribosomal peptide synthetase module n=2 Tax=Paenibacillus xerothermodurans TaxID=1977292 RepID=A0A2W1NKR3_PAEXE|nr:non-ribosomal peptide synthetase module [Paenibacillus xerothermodurans]
MAMFIQMFVDHQASMRVRILENGNQEVVLLDDAGQEIVLSFERQSGAYVCRGTCRITNRNLVNLMRKAVAAFKGSAIVHRHYETYTMVYEYERGTVVKIMELRNSQQKIIYAYKDTMGELEQLFRKDEVEQEISRVKFQINSMLDLRNAIDETAVREHIDRRLAELTHHLFVLEA